MAQFKDSPKAKDFVAKKPIAKQIQGLGHRIYPLLTIINTILLAYLIFNK